MGSGIPDPNGYGNGIINFNPSGTDMRTCWGVVIGDWGDNTCPRPIPLPCLARIQFLLLSPRLFLEWFWIQLYIYDPWSFLDDWFYSFFLILLIVVSYFQFSLVSFFLIFCGYGTGIQTGCRKPQ